MNETVDIIFFGAHPDDVELSAGGTAAKCVKDGLRVGIVDLTRGEMGTRGTPEIRAREALEAARIMKLDVRLNLEQPDGHVWPTEVARTAFVRVLRTHKPKVLLTTHEDDPPPDHANTSIIVRQSARLATMGRYDEGSGLSPMPMPAIMHSLFSRRIVPSFVVDVSDFVDEKMSAIKAYSSQFYNAQSNEPNTRISDRGFIPEIEYRMRYFGSLIGVAAGEPFYVREALNVDDPLALLTRPMNIYS